MKIAKSGEREGKILLYLRLESRGGVDLFVDFSSVEAY
jgi:hypothetical protein